MDTEPQEFPEAEEQISLSRRLGPGLVWNILTGLLLLGTLIFGLVFLAIFINPQSGLNPLPPTTMPALVPTDTPSPTPKPVLPPTWTPTFSPTPAPTNTPVPPTDTPPPSPTYELPPTEATQEASNVSFTLQEGSPSYTQNYVHEDAGCQWLGVAGQVFDEEGDPVNDILVTVRGTLGGEEINKFIFTGMAPEYGVGGYEIELAESPIASDGTLSIQLLEQTSNLALSDKIPFDTYDTCDKNLAVINFMQEPIDQ